MSSKGFRRWRLTAGDDRGSLPLALMLTLVGVTLSAALVPVALGQINATRDAARRGQELAAAQTGLDVALGDIRAASDGTGTGVVSALPCGPVSGSIETAGSPRYHVSIEYYPSNPKGQSDSWLTANRIACGSGPGPATLPAFALLRSMGTATATGSFGTVPARSIKATYPVQLATKTTTGGGSIRAYPASTPSPAELCLDAGSASPASGSVLLAGSCDQSTLGGARQRFEYQWNLTLSLVASRTAATPLGMCLDAGAPQVEGAPVQLKPCAVTTLPQQQWIFNDSGNFEATADGSTPNGLCLNVQMPGTAESFVVLGSALAGTCRKPRDPRQTFIPDPMTGSGAAGPVSGQIVNFGQFSRCLTVTDSAVTSAYLVATPCQQSPDPAAVGWSQRWFLPSPVPGRAERSGLITTDSPGGRSCLRSPGAPPPHGYATVVACPTGPAPPELTWTVRADTGDFTTSYRITDSFGLCLSTTNPSATPPDLHPVGNQTSKIIVLACGGAADQQWNAPTSARRAPPLLDVGEQ